MNKIVCRLLLAWVVIVRWKIIEIREKERKIIKYSLHDHRHCSWSIASTEKGI